MKLRWIILFTVVIAAVIGVYLQTLWFFLSCSGPDEFLIWGNTYKYGFTTYELQCYVGRFE